MTDESAVASMKEAGTHPITHETKQATNGGTIPIEASSLERLVSRQPNSRNWIEHHCRLPCVSTVALERLPIPSSAEATTTSYAQSTVQEDAEADAFEQTRGGGAYSGKWTGRWGKWQVCTYTRCIRDHITAMPS